MHREVTGATYGDGLVIEHVNGDKLDNRKANLRVRPALQSSSNTGRDAQRARATVP